MLLLRTTAASAETLPGFDHLAVDAKHRPRLLEASIWYPAASETDAVPIRANAAFGPAIDPSKITTLGFSLGRATALAAGGVRLVAPAFAAYCVRYGKDASEWVFFARVGGDHLTFLTAFCRHDHPRPGPCHRH